MATRSMETGQSESSHDCSCKQSSSATGTGANSPFGAIPKTKVMPGTKDRFFNGRFKEEKSMNLFSMKVALQKQEEKSSENISLEAPTKETKDERASTEGSKNEVSLIRTDIKKEGVVSKAQVKDRFIPNSTKVIDPKRAVKQMPPQWDYQTPNRN